MNATVEERVREIKRQEKASARTVKAEKSKAIRARAELEVRQEAEAAKAAQTQLLMLESDRKHKETAPVLTVEYRGIRLVAAPARFDMISRNMAYHAFRSAVGATANDFEVRRGIARAQAIGRPAETPMSQQRLFDLLSDVLRDGINLDVVSIKIVDQER